jgi:16S rRNA C967 or C1407 C5-methylase (RsmB/RsmF family)
VLPDENRAVIERLLEEDWTRLRLLKARELVIPPLVPRGDGDVQLLPQPRSAGPEAATDGFYYACLKSGGGSDNAA